MTGLAALWSTLRTEGIREDAHVRLRAGTVGTCAIYAAKRASTGLEALVVETATSSLPPDTVLPRSKGFDLTTHPLVPGRDGRTRILLELTQSRFQDVFRSLCEDVVRSMTAETVESGAMREFISRLARWQAFLHRHSAEGMSLEARRGLYGEISFLLLLIESGMPSARAVHAWTGCRRTSHDFQFESGHVEVKTTAASTPHAFHVSNATQLDPSGLPALFLHLIRVDEGEGAATTLPELVAAVSTRLEEQSRMSFADSLLEAGYVDAHHDLYAAPKYSIKSRRFFRVAQGFPMLVPESLPSGVEDVRYTVAVAACAPYEVIEHEVLQWISSSPEAEQ